MTREAVKENAQQAVAQVDGMILRMQGLKRKMEQIQEEQQTHLATTKARIDFLDKLSDPQMTDMDSDAYKQWSRTRVEMLVADYCLRDGCLKTGLAHCKNLDIEKLVDIDELTECHRIEESLRKDHQITACQAWCQENKQFLKKVRSGLEFEIKLQQFIELARANRKTEAIQYYRQQLVKNYSETHLAVLQQVSALLAFPPDQDVEHYAHFYADERWDSLARMFVETFQDLHGLPTRSALVRYVATGISALKTHSCRVYVEGEEEAPPKKTAKIPRDLSRAHMCPVCSVELRRLAASLPYAMHVTSRLEPDPVVLPNNRIYGLAKLLEYSKRVTGDTDKIVDPVTEETFGAHVYSMVYPT